MQKTYRQGDVFIIAVKKSQAFKRGSPIKRDKGSVVLAYGEVTGHAHRIDSPDANLFTVKSKRENDNDRFLALTKPVNLRHEEHETIRIPPGLYIVRRQREYTPDKIKYVAD